MGDYCAGRLHGVHLPDYRDLKHHLAVLIGTDIPDE
jgi:Cys-tRNA synthase (O-phospho-L-seryl-tRNA:Cys-tRNA synthase)